MEALQKLPEDYWYVIVGKGDLKDELEDLNHTGRLKLLGFRTDVVDLLHCADLFVFPSLQEGLPVALMEAMAAGLPCVASRIRGNSDLLPQNTVRTSIIVEWVKAIQCTDEEVPLKDTYGKNKIKDAMKSIYENI